MYVHALPDLRVAGEVWETVLVRKSLDLVLSLYEAQVSALAITQHYRTRSGSDGIEDSTN